MAARRWYGMGVMPIPLRWYSKMPVVKWGSFCPGDIQADMVDCWFKGVRRNLGLLLTGDLTVVDFDRPACYIAWATAHSLSTLTAKTHRGWHVYLRVKDKPAATMRMDGGEIKATGYVVAPPSYHPSGSQYRIVIDAPILEVDALPVIGIEPLEPILPPKGGWGSTSEYGEDGEDIVHQIKREVDIAGYLGRITTFARQGGYLMCRCPFHDDHTPSMMVVPEEQRCFCFNPQCVAHRQLDVIDVCALWLGITNSEAIRYLSQEV